MILLVGLTIVLHGPLPFPLTCVIPSFNFNVQSPDAVIVPDIIVEVPLHIKAAPLVIVATGRVFTVTIALGVVALQVP